MCASLPVLPAVRSSDSSFNSVRLRHRPRDLGGRKRIADRNPDCNEECKKRERFVAPDAGGQRKADVGIEPKPTLKDGGVRHVVGSNDIPNPPGKCRRQAHRKDARRKKDRRVAERDSAPRDREKEHRGKQHVEDELLGAHPEGRVRKKPGAKEHAKQDHEEVGKNEKKAGHGRE